MENAPHSITNENRSQQWSALGSWRTPYSGSMSDDMTALALREALRRREVSARELVADSLDRAAAAPGLGAFISLNPELALAEADEADARIGGTRTDERHELPPLTGLVTAHKDLADQRGHVTTHGSGAVPHALAMADGPVAAAVRTAGAVSIGKTQVPEFGIAGYSENEIAAPARNPFDPALTAGGSSGGTAAAIAAGLIPAAIGSDAGGSIRIPSAACGLVGLKPGRTAVPADAFADQPDTASEGSDRDRAGGGDRVPRMAVSGPMARTAADAAILFDALRGAYAEARRASDAEPSLEAVRRADELRGLRIGVSLASPFEGWVPIRFSSDALAAVSAAVATLESRGHLVEEARIAYDARYPQAFTTVWTAALARIRFAPGAEARLGALATMFLDRARGTSPEELATQAAALREFADSAARQWGAYDAVLTPALASAPPRVGAFRELGPVGDYRLQCEWAPQTSMVNVVGAPAVTAPVSRTAAGLPMGVQLIGRPGSEAMLLQLAEQLTNP